MKSVKEYQDKIMSPDTELDELYNIKVELSERIAQLHHNVSEAQTKTDQIEATGNMKVFYALQEVCDSRISDIKDTNCRFSHNFRMVAKRMLSKAEYKRIEKYAKMSRDEFKTVKL